MSNDKLREAVDQLSEQCDLSDDCQYGTLSTGFVRQFIAEMRAALSQPAVAQGWKLLKDSTHEERSWPEDASHENGSYYNTCCNCGRQFTGHKRRVICRVCDAAPQPAVAQDHFYPACGSISQPAVAQEPDDAAVDRFADAMKAKLAKAREKGRSGWETCSHEDLSQMLHDHVAKGDPLDVANFCMFLWNLGHDIAQPAVAQEPQGEAVAALWGFRYHSGAICDVQYDSRELALTAWPQCDFGEVVRLIYNSPQPAAEVKPCTLKECNGAMSCADCAQPAVAQPVDMVLYCPKCHTQHIDAPEPARGDWPKGWTNPPHKSHLCQNKACGHIWRPSDTPTNGVIATASGKDADTLPESEVYEYLVEAEWPDRFGVPLEVINVIRIGKSTMAIRVKPHEPREAIDREVYNQGVFPASSDTKKQ